MKVAIIHDHLAQQGGAEKVLEVLAEMFPEAPIYVLLYKQSNIDKYFPGRDIRSSIIQRLPWGVKHYRWYMALMPMAIEFYDLSDFDLVISSTSSFAKGVITKPETKHICYCHTPTRYLWSDTHQYISELRYNKYFKKIISLILNYVRIWDRQAADRVDFFIANSETCRQRIKKYYRRDSTIVYPSIEEEKFYISPEIGDYFLCGSRLVPYKRIDIVIEAFKGTNKKLKIFGDGLDLDRLKGLAAGCDNIEFLGRVSDEERAELFSKCVAFINPQKEDFGITIVEAMASGRPVIALGQGGATETVLAGVTGEFFAEEKSEDVAKAVAAFDHKRYDPQRIREHALKFSKENFKKALMDIVNKEIEVNQ